MNYICSLAIQMVEVMLATEGSQCANDVPVHIIIFDLIQIPATI